MSQDGELLGMNGSYSGGLEMFLDYMDHYLNGCLLILHCSRDAGSGTWGGSADHPSSILRVS